MASTSALSKTSTKSAANKGVSYVAALRIVEDREAQIRGVFDRFDLDHSGTIDMDELIVILDDLGMLHKLRSDPEEFVRDMFVKYDVNFDGVLSFAEFIGLHNAALMMFFLMPRIREEQHKTTQAGSRKVVTQHFHGIMADDTDILYAFLLQAQQ